MQGKECLYENEKSNGDKTPTVPAKIGTGIESYFKLSLNFLGRVHLDILDNPANSELIESFLRTINFLEKDEASQQH